MFSFKKSVTDRLYGCVAANPKFISASLTFAALGIVCYVLSKNSKSETASQKTNGSVGSTGKNYSSIRYCKVNGDTVNLAQGPEAYAEVAYAIIDGDIDNVARGSEAHAKVANVIIKGDLVNTAVAGPFQHSTTTDRGRRVRQTPNP
ncbi:MAG: hypothetical protein K0R66_1110 [Gammaproteobacteria bacterium]|jgi:hypothetical protein|nr:hypothetical protein [Gammaproteobacteria bacterium]